MPNLDLHLDGDGCWPDLPELRQQGRLIDYSGNETSVSVALLRNGTSGGHHSVTFRVNAPDGKVVLFELTWRLLYTAVKAMVVRVGIPAA